MLYSSHFLFTIHTENFKFNFFLLSKDYARKRRFRGTMLLFTVSFSSQWKRERHPFKLQSYLKFHFVQVKVVYVLLAVYFSYLLNSQVLHKFLTAKPRNSTGSFNGSSGNDSWEGRGLTREEILKNIHRYNSLQTIINEDIFGPVQNDTLIIVIQVMGVTYLPCESCPKYIIPTNNPTVKGKIP